MESDATRACGRPTPQKVPKRREAIVLKGGAPWLENRREDPVWTLPESNGPRRDKKRIFSFAYLLPDGSLLTDPENAHLYRVAKEYAVLIREGPFAISDRLSVDTHAYLVGSLLSIIGWMRLNGIAAFEALTKSDVDNLSSAAAYGVAAQLNAFERLREGLVRLIAEGRLAVILRRKTRDARPLDRSAALREVVLPDTFIFNSVTGRIFACLESAMQAHAANEDLIAALQSLEPPERTPVTRTELERKLRPLSDIWAARTLFGGDKLTFQPFPDGLGQVAASLGLQVGRTPTVPVRQAMELVDASIRWVVDYADPILGAHETVVVLREMAELDISDAVDLAVEQMRNVANGPAAPWPLIKSVRNRTDESLSVTLPDAVRFLVTAAVVVIATFTGRRIDEIRGITPKCVRGNSKEGFWIKTYIEKTNRRKELTPCPALVALAVEKLEQLSRRARGEDPDAEICNWVAVDVNDKKQIRAINPIWDLNNFAAVVRISRLKDDKVWHFTPHQFRRFFSIAYLWRYQLGDLAALSHHLRHTDIVATRRYVTEAAAGLLAEEEREFTKTILREAASGERRLGGAFGKRFQRILERSKLEIQKKVRIVMSDRLEKWIDNFVSKSHILLKSNPWSYCVCPDTVEGAAHANCQRSAEDPQHARGADFARAAPHVCSGCFHNCTDLIFRPYVEEEIRLVRRRLKDPSLPTLARTAEKKRLCDLLNYLEADFKM